MGMIVKEPDLFDGKPVLLQCTSAMHFNLISGKEANGIQVNDIALNHADVKKTSYDDHPDDPVVCVYRSLKIKRSEEEEKKCSANLVKFIKEANGIEYSEGTGMEMLYIMGVVGLELGESTGTDEDRTYYCASYIADAFMQYGIITEEFMHQQYSPRDFAERYNNLPYASLDISHGPEYAVDYE